jgi:hypothetical protein
VSDCSHGERERIGGSGDAVIAVVVMERLKKR